MGKYSSPQQAQGRHSKDATSAGILQAAGTGEEPCAHHQPPHGDRRKEPRYNPVRCMIMLDYKIVRSPKRKKLTITVERDRAIIVHAPQGISEEELRRVVDAKRQWILAKLRHPQKYQDRLHPPGKEVVNGESAPYLGRGYRIEMVDTPSGEIEFSRSFHIPPPHLAKRRKVLRDWYIARAKEPILARAERHARDL